jgi:hypothetical protein
VTLCILEKSTTDIEDFIKKPIIKKYCRKTIIHIACRCLPKMNVAPKTFYEQIVMCGMPVAKAKMGLVQLSDGEGRRKNRGI